MAISLGTNTAASSTTSGNITTSAIDTSLATLLVVGIAQNDTGGAPVAPVDSKTNAWVQASLREAGGSVGEVIWYCKAPTVGTGHQFSTAGGAGSYPSIYVAAFRGTDQTANRDQEANFGTGGTTIQTIAGITPTADNCLVLTLVGTNTVATLSIDSGFTILNQLAFSPSNAYGGALAYRIQTTAAAINPTWTISTTAALVMGLVDFKASTGAPAGWGARLADVRNRRIREG